MTTSETIRLGLAWLGTYGLHSTILLGAAWAWSRWFPPRRLLERERVWRWALIGGLLSASLQVGLDRRALGWTLEWPAEAAAPTANVPAGEPGDVRPAETAAHPALRSPDRDAVVPTLERPAAERSAARSRPQAAGREREEPSAVHASRASRASSDVQGPPLAVLDAPTSSSRSSAPEPGSAPIASLEGLPWPSIVLAGWAGLAGLGVLRILLSWGSLRRRMAGRVPITSGPLFERFQALRQRAGIRGRVRLSLCETLCSPFSVGILRREVCVPVAVITDLGPRQQEAILAHELAHVARHDPAWSTLLTWIERLLFFQPLHRLARRELAELAELACDERAVHWTGGRLTLAGTLTEVAGWVLDGRPQVLQLPGLVGHRSPLARRIARLLQEDTPREHDVRRWWMLPVGAVALAGITLAAPGIASGSVREPVPPAGEPSPESRLAPDESPSLHPDPVPAQVRPHPAVDVDDLLQREQRRLAEELDLLRSGVDELTAELAGKELGETFADALARLAARLAELEQQHARIRALLDRLRAASAAPSPITPTSEPTFRR
jgi:beta-lactamase regulating signal transducer with metallopeptidase domain